MPSALRTGLEIILIMSGIYANKGLVTPEAITRLRQGQLQRARIVYVCMMSLRWSVYLQSEYTFKMRRFEW